MRAFNAPRRFSPKFCEIGLRREAPERVALLCCGLSIVRPLDHHNPKDTMNSAEQNALQPTIVVQELPSQSKTYCGIRRLGYFFGMFGVSVLKVILAVVAQGEPSVGIFSLILTLALSLGLIASRLHNIGMSGWWAVLTFVPIANIILGVRCLMMPEGYQDTKKLDTAAKVILGAVLGLAVLVVVCLAVISAG